jgi:flavin-dependent dehydrogenase
MESREFLLSLGLKLDEMRLPVISNLIVSSPGGNFIEQALPLGGFGISRYTLDQELFRIAKAAGVQIYDGTKVNDIVFNGDIFNVAAGNINIIARVTAGTFGKRSNIDIKWSREFITKKSNRLDNYIGVKYHVRTDLPGNTIALHNFKDGYCGISKIENDTYCLCYLTTAENLNANNNSIPLMEKNVLQKNPFLKKIFTTATFLPGFPVTISQVSFKKKTQCENHVLMTGDAAGMITPLCGNGMSMALHGSKTAFGFIDNFLKGTINRKQMETLYTREWRKLFSRRLQVGRAIHRFFGKEILTNLFISAVKPFPFIIRKLIRATHGDPF